MVRRFHLVPECGDLQPCGHIFDPAHAEQWRIKRTTSHRARNKADSTQHLQAKIDPQTANQTQTQSTRQGDANKHTRAAR